MQAYHLQLDRSYHTRAPFYLHITCTQINFKNESQVRRLLEDSAYSNTHDTRFCQANTQVLNLAKFLPIEAICLRMETVAIGIILVPRLPILPGQSHPPTSREKNHVGTKSHSTSAKLRWMLLTRRQLLRK